MDLISRRGPERHAPKLTAIDLFSGAGGLSQGLTQAGFEVRAAVEFDPVAASSYGMNHTKTTVLVDDIRNVTGPQLLSAARLDRNELALLTGCPPCQGFSTLQTRRLHANDRDPRNELIFEILRLTRSTRPLALIVENVPGLKDNKRFQLFTEGLVKAGYSFAHSVLNAADYGVPQRRKRLVLIAIRGATIPPQWAPELKRIRTVRDAIFGLPKAGASGDLLHDFPEQRSSRIMDRIAATPKDGGSRKDVPNEMACNCHIKSDGYHDVYGRMSWDSESPTITSGCTNPSKGRFLHPVEDRAITLREAALLQSFPADYQFDTSRGKEHAALQIGNAFPPNLIHEIAKALRRFLNEKCGVGNA